MKYLKFIIPNLAIVLNVSMLVIVYLHMRNPMMGFLECVPFFVLVTACAICSVASAVLLYAMFRGKKNG